MDFRTRWNEYRPGPLLGAVQIFLLVLIIVGIGLLCTQKLWVPKLVEYILRGEVSTVTPTPTPGADAEREEAGSSGYKDATYTIGGKEVALVNGLSEVEIVPGAASKLTTRVFGNELWKDLNSDGVEDVVFLLTQEGGGSGTFFYVVAALKTSAGFTGSEAVFLGDRIAPQTTESGPGASIIVNYADRASGESFAVQPSVGKSLRLLLDPATMQFGEVVQDFEGEADPETMTLGMKTWEWMNTEYHNVDVCTCPSGYVKEGESCTPTCYFSEPRCLAPSIMCERTGGNSVVTPKKPGVFSLTFGEGGRVNVTTDCNSVGGTYRTGDDRLTFEQMMSTLMYCEGSQEAEFVGALTETESYSFTSKGGLMLRLKDKKGVMNFR